MAAIIGINIRLTRPDAAGKRTANGVRVGDDHETLDTSPTSWMDGDIT